MKKFNEYQCIPGEVMTDRDKQEVNSKFWNEGKWNTFIKPILPWNCKGLTLVDIGCNAGLFLKLAEDRGFKAIGIDSNKEAIERGLVYKEKNGGSYSIYHKRMESCLESLPVVDYTVIANTHYYFSLKNWIKYIENLKTKTRYVIIITAEKKPNKEIPSTDLQGIRNDFKDWKEINVIDIPKDDTPHSRHLTSICFKSNLERVDINILDNGNAQQRDFLQQLDNGINLFKTDYYRRLKSYRRHIGSKQQTWTEQELTDYMNERVVLYEDVKKNGLKQPIIVRQKDNRIVDGNHRHEILKHLGYKKIIIKYE